MIDTPTLEEAFRLYRHKVFGVCLAMLKNREDAEDLTQEVFIQLHRKLNSFNGESAFTTWLHRVTVNQVLMWLRKTKKKRDNTASLDDPDEYIASEGNAYHISPEVDIDVQNVMNTLAHGYHNVLYLHDVMGYEHREIAGIGGFSEGTSKSQLHKARKKAQQLYNKRANPRVYGSTDS